MAPLLRDFSPKKVLVLFFVLVFMASIICISASTEVQSQQSGFLGRRKMLGIGYEEVDEPIIKKKASSALLSKTKQKIELEEDDEEPIVEKKSSSSLESKTKKQRELEEDEEDEPIIKKKTSSSLLSKTKNQTKLAMFTTTNSSKNETKLIKNPIGSKNQAKLLKSSIGSSTDNETKLIKSSSDSTKNKTKLINSSFEDQPTIKTKLKKLNSTNSAKTLELITKKTSDLAKTSSAKNKTAKATISKESKNLLDQTLGTETKPKSNASSDKKPKTEKNKPSEGKPQSEKSPKQTLPRWVDQDDDDDLVSEFRALPSKFQETLLPDLERISKTSKVYLTKANKEITKGFKPYVGNKYAPTIASFISFAFILIPLVLVSLIFSKIKAYFSLQKFLIFVQVYLSIYFSILCLSSLITGLEPLKFLYATSQSTYVCLQVLQTLAYVLYLLLLVMYLVLVFSTETGLATKLLGLGQTFVGYAVGLHYYVTVFHMAVLRQPPKTSWKIHAIYATCFLLICVLTRVDRRKKA